MFDETSNLNLNTPSYDHTGTNFIQFEGIKIWINANY